ncbi:hypothetical protein ACQJBY_018762 [Aegilops geniculata]
MSDLFSGIQAAMVINRVENSEQSPEDWNSDCDGSGGSTVGHVLAPTAKHDYISIDFWAALGDISKIKDWNWGGYVLKNLFQAVKKFKADMYKRNPTVHIVGCHLFLQLFILDSLDLGVLNMLRDVTPRIGLYDYDLMKKMVDKITVNVGAGEVSYHGAMVRTELSVSNLIGFPSKETFTAKAAKWAPRRANATCAPMLQSSYTKTGPHEFSNYIRTWYPSISTEKLGILLREQNARGLASISEMRQVFQSNMFTFTDKLMACLADSCTCCKAHGNKKCILGKDGTNACDAPPHVPTDQTQFSTPLVSKIGPRLPAPGNPSSCLSANSSAARKRDGSLSSSVQSGTAKKTCSRETQDVLDAAPPLNSPPFSVFMTTPQTAYVQTTVLANADPLTVHSIRATFQEGTTSCNPASCRMWYIPTILPDCWSVYAFDMLRKIIIVFDPTVGPFGYSNRRVSMHEFVSNKLHAALFTCLQNFFSSWHCESSHWGRTFPITMRENIEKEQTGLCATFFAWNYDGDKVQTPLNKDTLASHSSLMIYELMKMQGNQTTVANDALEAVKGSFIAL